MRNKNSFEIQIEKNLGSILKKKMSLFPLNDTTASKINHVSIMSMNEKIKEKRNLNSFFKKKDLEINVNERVSFRDLFDQEKSEKSMLNKRSPPSNEKSNHLKKNLNFFTPIYSSEKQIRWEKNLPKDFFLKDLKHKESFHSEKGKK